MTKVFAVLGDARVAKSYSPAMHNAVLAAHGLDAVYVPLRVEPGQVPAAMEGVRALHLAGVNVTVPHKPAVAACMDELSPQAARLGAVNTVAPVDGRLIGHNTDVGGLLWALGQAGFDPAGRSCLVVGAGGAARAVVLALAEAGARLVVASRRAEQATELATNLGGTGAGLDQAGEIAAGAELIVNASAVSDPAEGPELAAVVVGWRPAACRLVLDINYGRRVNLWRDLAQGQGAAFQDGRPMLAGQAAYSFGLWTGLSPDPRQFLAALPA